MGILSSKLVRLLPGEVIVQKRDYDKLKEDKEYLEAFFGTFGLVTDIMSESFRQIQAGVSADYAQGRYDACKQLRDEMVKKMDKRRQRDGEPIPF